MSFESVEVFNLEVEERSLFSPQFSFLSASFSGSFALQSVCWKLRGRKCTKNAGVSSTKYFETGSRGFNCLQSDWYSVGSA